MKKFFHPLLISLAIAIFPIISQAVDTPQGFILSVLSIQMKDVGAAEGAKINTSLNVHVRRPFEASSADIGNMVMAEHYIFDTWSDVQSFEKVARFPEQANVFLSDKATVDQEMYSVCFELQNIGLSCAKVPAKKGANSVLLIGSDRLKPFAVLRYKMYKAIVSPVTMEDFLSPNSSILVRLDEIETSQTQQTGYQIRVSPQGKPVSGFLGEMSPTTQPKVIAPEQSYHDDLSLMVPYSDRFSMVQTFRSELDHSRGDVFEWKRFPINLSTVETDSSFAQYMNNNDTKFLFSFYKIKPEPTYVNWLDISGRSLN